MGFYIVKFLHTTLLPDLIAKQDLTFFTVSELFNRFFSKLSSKHIVTCCRKSSSYMTNYLSSWARRVQRRLIRAQIFKVGHYVRVLNAN
nr:hypothetical transcript [Hymenolepis microstoma]